MSNLSPAASLESTIFDDLLTLDDIARDLKIEVSLAMYLIELGELPGSWLDGFWRVSRHDLEAWKSQMATGSSATATAVAPTDMLRAQSDQPQLNQSDVTHRSGSAQDGVDYRKQLEIRARQSKTFCAAPWVHFLTVPDGSVLPCCMAKDAVRDEQGGGVNVRATDPAIIWNGPGFRAIRQALLDGETIPHCVTCYHTEAIGHSSYRQKFNLDYFGDDEQSRRKSFLDRVPDPSDPLTAGRPIFFDIRLGNICNLKCRMCGPNLSSQIEKDKVASSWVGGGDQAVIGANVNDWPEAVELLSQLKNFVVDSLHLELVGGEPTLNQAHITILQHLVDEGLSKNIDVLMISNLTNTNDNIYELLGQFRSSVVHFNVEAIGAVNDYIRAPAKWSVTSKRLLATREKFSNIWFGVSPTFQAYNVLSLTDLFDWCRDNDLIFGSGNILHYPDWLSVVVLPWHIRNIAADRVQAWTDANAPSADVRHGLDALVAYLRDESLRATDEQLRDFVRYTNDLDITRGQDIRVSLPELYALLNEHQPWDHGSFRHKTLKIGRQRSAIDLNL